MLSHWYKLAFLNIIKKIVFVSIDFLKYNLLKQYISMQVSIFVTGLMEGLYEQSILKTEKRVELLEFTW